MPNDTVTLPTVEDAEWIEARYYFRHPEAWCSRCRLMTKQATNKENAR